MSFLRKLWKDLKKVIIIFLLLSIASSVFYTVKKFGLFSRKARFSAIIDSNSGNGIDNMLAISRALASEELDIIGLSSQQWNYFPSPLERSMEISRSVNDTLLMFFNKPQIPLLRGNPEMITYSNKHNSEAAEFIVKNAREHTPRKKLNIISFGPLTNIASAILLDSGIVPSIRVYSVVMKYNPSSKVWNKNEFNARNDIDALDILLNQEELELHIMPATGSGELILQKSEILELLNEAGKNGSFYAGKIKSSGADENIKLPGISLIEAFLNPDYAKQEQISTPPENKRRKIYVYTKVNKNFMEIDFWNTFKDYSEDNWRN